MSKSIVIRHDIKDILGALDCNKFRDPSLRDYYLDDFDKNAPIDKMLLNEMTSIVQSITSNIDPNDSNMVTFIREYLNKLCATNVSETKEKLLLLNYSAINHFELLANELILKCMNDVMAYKGLESSEPTMTELCVQIIQTFYPFCIQGDKTTFGQVLSSKCYKYFTDFLNITDKTAYMNKFNTQRVNNYKGLVNLIGHLYVAELFSDAIIVKCVASIKKQIVESDLSQEECDNYHSGYNLLIQRVLEDSRDSTIELLKTIQLANKEILDTAQSNLDLDIDKSELKNCIRKYSMTVHGVLMSKIDKIIESR